MKRNATKTIRLLTIPLLFLLAATAAAQRPLEGVSLTVSVWASDLVDHVFQPLVAEFEEETGATVQFDAVAWGNLREKQVIELVGQRGAFDVVLIVDVWLPEYAMGNLILPLDAYADEQYTAGFLPDLLATGAYEDVQYGIPALNNAIGLIYRHDLFAEAGLEQPDTWSALLAAVEALNDPAAGQYAVAVPAQRGAAMLELFEALLRTTGEHLFDADWTPRFDTPEALATLEFFLDLVAASPPGAPSWHWPEARAALYDGLATMHFGGIAIAPGLENPAVTRHPGQFTVAPLPVPDERVGEPYDRLLLNYSWSIARNSENPDAAWAFVEWVTSPRVERALAESRLPLLVDSSQHWYYEDEAVLAARPIATTLLGMYEQGRTAPNIPEWAEIRDEVALHFSQAVVGQISAQEALDRAQDSALTILRRSGYF